MSIGADIVYMIAGFADLASQNNMRRVSQTWQEAIQCHDSKVTKFEMRFPEKVYEDGWDQYTDDGQSVYTTRWNHFYRYLKLDALIFRNLRRSHVKDFAKFVIDEPKIRSWTHQVIPYLKVLMFVDSTCQKYQQIDSSYLQDILDSCQSLETWCCTLNNVLRVPASIKRLVLSLSSISIDSLPTIQFIESLNQVKNLEHAVIFTQFRNIPFLFARRERTDDQYKRYIELASRYSSADACYRIWILSAQAAFSNCDASNAYNQLYKAATYGYKEEYQYALALEIQKGGFIPRPKSTLEEQSLYWNEKAAENLHTIALLKFVCQKIGGKFLPTKKTLKPS